MTFPIGDWQFYVVTAVAVGGAWALLRPFLRRRRAGAPCSGCGPAAETKRTRATLTVGGRPSGARS